ncbi:8393_t:CDS:2 [Funneliformis geosporum]|uniref:10624_t:CDS:1 n=1 Tax=Funneliformis geosporum TaxID=1117311 RepID=A0A9W4SU07_9GLOM|nr:10624_t:CDS:2 [Funneliformis geosporum]CAI2189652.1 8393_t:CDS:2 [Funneliformis geosporum]
MEWKWCYFLGYVYIDYGSDTDLVKKLAHVTDQVADTFGANGVPRILRVIEILEIKPARKFFAYYMVMFGVIVEKTKSPMLGSGIAITYTMFLLRNTQGCYVIRCSGPNKRIS